MEKTLAEVKEGLRVMAYDFAVRIEPVYKALNWKWLDSHETPTIEEIEETILQLINDLQAGYTNQTGGLEVSWIPTERCYYISFIDDKTLYY